MIDGVYLALYFRFFEEKNAELVRIALIIFRLKKMLNSRNNSLYLLM